MDAGAIRSLEADDVGIRLTMHPQVEETFEENILDDGLVTAGRRERRDESVQTSILPAKAKLIDIQMCVIGRMHEADKPSLGQWPGSTLTDHIASLCC